MNPKSRLRHLLEDYQRRQRGLDPLDESFEQIESLIRQYDKAEPEKREMLGNHLERHLTYVGEAVGAQIALHERSMADLSGVEGADEIVQNIARELQKMAGSKDPQQTAMIANQLADKFGSLSNLLQQVGANTAADLGPMLQQMLQHMF